MRKTHQLVLWGTRRNAFKGRDRAASKTATNISVKNPTAPGSLSGKQLANLSSSTGGIRNTVGWVMVSLAMCILKSHRSRGVPDSSSWIKSSVVRYRSSSSDPSRAGVKEYLHKGAAWFPRCRSFRLPLRRPVPCRRQFRDQAFRAAAQLAMREGMPQGGTRPAGTDLQGRHQRAHGKHTSKATKTRHRAPRSDPGLRRERR